MKTYQSWLLGALACATIVPFTGCTKDEMVGPNGGNGETVKTEFAINVPAAGKLQTRVTEDIVQGQETPVFRGMDNIHLIPFTTEPVIGGAGSTPVQLGAIQPNELGTGTNAKVYYDVQLAEGVSHFLFYGKAIDAEGGNQKNGVLDATISENVNEINFKLKQFMPTYELNTEASTLLTSINNVAKVEGWSSSTEFKSFYDLFIRMNAGSAASIKSALSDLKDGIEDVTPVTETDLKSKLISAIESAISNLSSITYPRNLGLPDGSAQIKWNTETLGFEYINSENIGDLNYLTMQQIVYPASLYYWVKTPIKTSDTPLADQYSTNWSTCLELYNDGETSVTSSTASVALENPINYAVGRMDVSVKFSSDELTDNLGETVNITTSDGFVVNGLLIGGQKNLKWDFATPVDETVYTIYDSSTNSTDKLESTSPSAPQIYSLALQTAASTDVRFALELTNGTGASFVGKDGTVPAGGRFYLIGTLKPAADKANGCVFYQDYKTVANVTINSFENAYNCIPDLKEPGMELGLSVDLDWKEGQEIDVVIP